jgi:hypothetical protein
MNLRDQLIRIRAKLDKAIVHTKGKGKKAVEDKDAFAEVDNAWALLNTLHEEWDEGRAGEDELVVLHLSDWNMQDRFYLAPLSLLMEFGDRILEFGGLQTPKSKNDPWEWWTSQTNYDNREPDLPIRYLQRVSTQYEQFFLDFMEPVACVKEWKEQWAC